MRRLALLATAFALTTAVPASSVLAAKVPSAAVKIATATARARFHTTRIVSVFSLRSRRDSRWALVDGFATARDRPWAAWLHRDTNRWTLRYFDTRAPFQPGSNKHGRVPCDLYPAFSEPSCRPVGAAALRVTATRAFTLRHQGSR